jgi:hypothetical protein
MTREDYVQALADAYDRAQREMVQDVVEYRKLNNTDLKTAKDAVLKAQWFGHQKD